VDSMLTLKGLLILYEKNKGDRKPCMQKILEISVSAGYNMEHMAG